MQQKFLFSLLAAATALPSWSQTSEPEVDNIQIKWGLSAGANRYTEPGLMQLKGPEVGVHARLSQWEPLPNAYVEADILLGQQSYTSKSSGSMRGVTNLETRWRAMLPLFRDASTNANFDAGLAVHTLWNDLRGTSTFQGVTYGGYQRSAAQLWLPIRWKSDDVWTLDAGWLIYGQHTSKLSEVGPSYKDAINTQRHGQYAQLSMQLKVKDGDEIKPFIRYTHLGDSDTVVINGPQNKCPRGFCTATEPMSNRWQIGAIWEFNTP
jgi:hypothetical protein